MISAFGQSSECQQSLTTITLVQVSRHHPLTVPTKNPLYYYMVIDGDNFPPQSDRGLLQLSFFISSEKQLDTCWDYYCAKIYISNDSHHVLYNIPCLTKRVPTFIQGSIKHSVMKSQEVTSLPQKEMMWLLSSCTNFRVTASSIICFT